MGAIHFSLDEKLMIFFKDHLKIDTFVETGTFKGDTLKIAAKHFSDCYSVELSAELYARVADQFKLIDGVDLRQGDSVDFLREYRSKLAGTPVLFWLDAHWCVASGTAGEASQSPLLDELKAIGTLHPDSVLLIDDARLYLSTPPAPHAISDWPDFQEVSELLASLSETHRVTIFDDVIAYYPEALRREVSNHIHKTAVDWLHLVNQSKALEGLNRAPFLQRLRWAIQRRG